MADRNYVSSDFAAKLERARKRTQRMPQQRRAMPYLPPPPTVSSVFRVLNGGDETIPQYAVMQVENLAEQSGFEGAREAYRVVKPDGDGTLFLINAGGEIEARHFGGGIFADEPCKVLIDEEADPEFLDTFGPVEDEWHLSSEGSGFAFLGLPDEEEGTAIFREGTPDGVLFRNDSSETMPAYGVGRITGDEDVSGRSVTKITKPDTTFSREYLVNGGSTVSVGSYGFGYMMNGRKVLALYDSGTPAYGEGWGPKPNQWSLTKGYYGFTVLGNNDTSDLTTWVKGNPIERVFGKLDAALGDGETETVSIWATASGTEEDTTMNLTGEDWFMKSGATDIASGTKCKLDWMGNAWYFTLFTCP